MNKMSTFSEIDGQDKSRDALKYIVQSLTEKNILLEQKYLEASNRCAVLEKQNFFINQSKHIYESYLSDIEKKIHVLNNIIVAIDESLAHSWFIANHPLFKTANKSVQIVERSEHSRIHSIMAPLDRSKNYINALINTLHNEYYEYHDLIKPKPVVTEALTVNSSPYISQLRSILNNKYQKFDILIFGTIDYDYLYQRPQHFADYFASIGHRVFYVNVSFHQEYDFSIYEKRENLFLVTLPCFSHDIVYSADLSNPASETAISLENLLFSYGINDAVMIADHPNWVHLMLQLKQKTGFPIITDYMDDFTGFENDEQDLVAKSCLHLLKNSDLVIASSLYLEQKASKYNSNVTLIRNGTDFSHFNTAYREPNSSPKKVIGYYGAISSWFDYQKIYSLSSRFPEHDIVLIGDVLESKKNLFTPLQNVKLLGVKPYSILPEYLKSFDVCLIPFDSSLSLIKATNPVKFYEYLSAAKKIVATEMPELMPFRDQYVYLANDDQTFGDYVELCLNGNDRLASAEECMRFARKNDWLERAKCFAECVNAQFPKVTIVLNDSLCDFNRPYIKTIQENTAYPNYTIVPMRDVSAEIYSNCDYIVFLKENTIVFRGWLTKLLQAVSASHRNAVCPTSIDNFENCKTLDLPLQVYLHEAKNALNRTCVADTSSDACVIVSAELAQTINLLGTSDPISVLRNSNIDIIQTNTVIIKTD